MEQEPLIAKIDTQIASLLGLTLRSHFSDDVLEYRAKSARGAGLIKLQDLLRALGKRKDIIPLFAARCRSELWPQHPTSEFAERGISVYQLSMLEVASHGVEPLGAFFKTIGLADITWDLSRQVGIARELVAHMGGHT